MKRQLILSGFVALIVSLGTFAVLNGFTDGKNDAIKIDQINSTPTNKVLFQQTEDGNYVPLDYKNG